LEMGCLCAQIDSEFVWCAEVTATCGRPLNENRGEGGQLRERGPQQCVALQLTFGDGDCAAFGAAVWGGAEVVAAEFAQQGGPAAQAAAVAQVGDEAEGRGDCEE